MPVGTTVRRALGRFEPVATRVYRSVFIDLDSLATTIRSVAPHTKRILDVGCGDGELASALRRALPDTEYLGIDPAHAAPGRMYDGHQAGIEFRSLTTSELLSEQPVPFDLVVLVDVLHHVPDGQRAQVLADAAHLTVTSGTLAVKEWEDRGPASTAIAFAADRWITGDPAVRFMPRPELNTLIASATAGWEITCEARIPPRRANLLLTLRRPS